MSDGFRPSSGAVGKLGEAFTNLGMTIFGKLDSAERASEYNNGLETLRRGLTTFDQSLETNPDWRKYPELAAQRENDLIAEVLQKTNHPGAKNDLQTQWQSMRDSHLETIGNISNRVRIKTYHADGVNRLDQREKQVQDGTLTAAEADRLNTADLKQMSDTGVFDPTAALVEGNQRRYTIQTSEAGRKVREAARASGWDSAIQQIPQILGSYSELKTPGEIDAFTHNMEVQRDYSEKRQEKQNALANDQAEIPLSKEYLNVMVKGGDLSNLEQLVMDASSKWQGVKEAADLNDKWANKIKALRDGEHQLFMWEKAGRGGYDTEAGNNLQVQMWSPDMTPEAKLDLVTKAMKPGKDANGKEIPPQVSRGDAKKLASSIKDSSTVIHDSSLRIQGLSAKDANGNPGPLDAEDVKIGQAMLQEMVDKTPDLKPSQIADETDRISEYLQAKKVRAALSKAFQGDQGLLMQAEGLTAGLGVPGGKTTEGMRMIKAIGQAEQSDLKKKGIEAALVGVDQKNRPIFRGAKGEIYFQDVQKGKLIWYEKLPDVVEAGKTRKGEWLTLK